MHREGMKNVSRGNKTACMMADYRPPQASFKPPAGHH